jgi:hypothetical protein
MDAVPFRHFYLEKALKERRCGLVFGENQGQSLFLIKSYRFLCFLKVLTLLQSAVSAAFRGLNRPSGVNFGALAASKRL